jgi:hypothetical protein
LFKLAGDVLYISQDGLVPLAGSLQSSRVDPRVALTDKIQYAVSSAVTNYGGNYGWSVLYFASENMLILNVPISEGSGQQQYVMNTISRSWCNFTGMAANCWEVFDNSPYFGGDGFVAKAWNGYVDDTSNIEAVAIPAFSDYGATGYNKRWTMTRPIFRANGTPSVLSSMNVDFNIAASTNPISFSPPAFASWDSGIWDSALWGADFNIIQNWQGVSGVGKYGSNQMQIASQGIDVRWVSTDVVFEVGTIL